jgi:hypothetical protein
MTLRTITNAGTLFAWLNRVVIPHPTRLGWGAVRLPCKRYCGRSS